MSLHKLQGVVLKSTNLSESDKIITIFSDKIGKIDVVVHGARKQKSRYLSSSQPFCYADFVVFEGKSLYTINQSSIIESFQSILMDLEKLSYGSYFLELIDNITEKEVKYVSLLALLLKTLYLIVHGETDMELLRLAVSFKAISMVGYMPRLKSCVRCGKALENGQFSIREGGLVCVECSTDMSGSFGINKETLKFLHTLKNIKLEDLRYIKYEEKMLAYLQYIFEKYINFHTDKELKSIGLINALKE